MSSTSSSECECNDNYHYNASIYGRTPFYPTMGHPLIYYAQIPQPSRRRQSRERNDNCFVKAFRWYTQEHVPHNDSSDRTDMSGFAAWLDSKYDEFLRDGPLDQNIHHLKMKHTSIIEADRTPYITCCEPRAKRFRVKSPWRRKRRPSSNEAGDTIQKPNHSFQFILQPKDLSRPASECCQQSTTTMQSTEIPTKPTIKSQSYTCLSQEKRAENAEPTDTITIHERKTESLVNTTKDVDVKFISESDLSKVELQNISCQCSGTKVVKIDAQTQCDDKFAKRVELPDKLNQPSGKTKSAANKEILKPVIPRDVQINIPVEKNCRCSEKTVTTIGVNEYQSNKVESSLSVTQRSKISLCPCERDEEEFKVDLIYFPTTITFSSDAVQTSDHSIRLEKDASHGYPLFMKIVCADKLCK